LEGKGMNYKDLKKDIPVNVLDHLEGLIEETGLPENDESRKTLADAWLTKRALFNRITEHENFKPAESMKKNSKGGCIAITYSGSIITIGPLVGSKREVKYTSIAMRTDVPETVTENNAVIASDIICGKNIIFKEGSIKKTSPIMDLALSLEAESEKKQLESRKKAGKRLKDDFIKVNKQVLKKDVKKDILKNRNDLFNKWIILEWFVAGGLEKHIFKARAKILWLELFTEAYEAVNKKKKTKEEKDTEFLDFTNRQFAKFIDDYKWYESEKKNFDIGLMKALEELPVYDGFTTFSHNFAAA
jgi:hypothetical protein